LALGEALREFGVKISLAFDQKKVDAAQDSIAKLGSKMRGFAFDVTAISAALFESQNLFTSNARAMEDQSAILGITSEKLAEYEYAAKVGANVNRDELVGSFQKLADTMDLARAGVPEATQAIYQMGQAAGIGGSELLGKMRDPAFKVTDAMRVMADGIKNMSATSPQAAARLAEFALGNAKLVPLLRQGSGALDMLTAEGKKNFALTDKMYKQGKAMDVQITKLWLTFRKFGYEIGYKVMKHLAPMIAQFQKWFALNKNIIASDINAFLDTLADVLKAVYQGATVLFEAFHSFSDYVGGASNAIKILVGALVAFKAISFAASVASMVSSFGGLAVMAVKIVPAFISLGASVAGVLGPLLAIVAAATAGYELGKKLNELINEKTGGEGIGGKIYDWLHPGETTEAINNKNKAKSPGMLNKMQTAAKGLPSADQFAYAAPAASAGTSGAGPVNQTNNNHITQNIAIPPGTTVPQAAAILSKSHEDSDARLRKANADAMTTRTH